MKIKKRCSLLPLSCIGHSFIPHLQSEFDITVRRFEYSNREMVCRTLKNGQLESSNPGSIFGPVFFLT